MNSELQNDIFEAALEYWSNWNYNTTKDQWLDNAFDDEFIEDPEYFGQGSELEHEKVYENKIDKHFHKLMFETELKNLMKKYPKMEWVFANTPPKLMTHPVADLIKYHITDADEVVRTSGRALLP